jgi:hypothetical protein
MEEIKLWKVDGFKESLTIADVSSVGQTKSLLLNGLKLVGRQTETPGGPLDLLGVDEDGQLIVFELKRGTLTRDAVAQIVDYASYLAELAPSDLSNLISQGSGKLGVEKIDDFAEWYQLQFGKNPASIGKPKMMLVGLGVDDRARRMVEHFGTFSDQRLSRLSCQRVTCTPVQSTSVAVKPCSRGGFSGIREFESSHPSQPVRCPARRDG